MGKTHQSIEKTRRQLIDASIAVISRDGIARATTRRIADEAGLPTGTFHYCFDTKEDLLAAACESTTMQGLRDIGAEVPQGAGILGGIAAIVRASAKWITRRPDIQKAQVELTLWSWRSEKYHHLAQRNYRRYLDGIIQLLRESHSQGDPDLDLEAVARMILAVLDGATLQWISLRDNAFIGATELGIEAIQAYVLANGTMALSEEVTDQARQQTDLFSARS